MTDWINRICDEVDRIAALEPYYQELDTERKKLEPAYQQILETLSNADREVITQYVYLLSELAYQKTQTAYHIGCRQI